MNRQHLVVGAIAVMIVAVAIGSILVTTRKNRIELTGQMLRVRTHQLDAQNTVVLADIRISNPSTQDFVVQDVEVYLDNLKGDTFSEIDAKRLFEYYPVLGKKYNENLTIRHRIKSGESVDRMLSVGFKATEEQVANRGAIRLVITEADGAKTEIVEKRT
jgi:hypothetical protein